MSLDHVVKWKAGSQMWGNMCPHPSPQCRKTHALPTQIVEQG